MIEEIVHGVVAKVAGEITGLVAQLGMEAMALLVTGEGVVVTADKMIDAQEMIAIDLAKVGVLQG